MRELKPLIKDVLPRIIRLRHQLHQHPEIGYQEFETSKLILSELSEIPKLQVTANVAETGVVATLGAEKKGPCLALRADMDCLPITEETGRPYASKRPGLMHACGHDGHVAGLLGAVHVLSQISDELKGPVKFIFQPAEENGAGAKKMCEEGALDMHVRADAIFGLHGWPELELGKIGVISGPTLASVDDFTVKITGRGTHAASPHKGVDPIYVASHVVLALQAVVSRQTDPLENIVLTIARINGGTSSNVISEEASITGTLRCFNPEVRKTSLEQILRITQNVAAAFGAEARLSLDEGYPSLCNEEQATRHLERTALEVLGQGCITTKGLPAMVSEDFAFYLHEIPGCFWMLGVRPPGVNIYPSLHNPRFDFYDEALSNAVLMHCEVARRFAGNWNR